jgi:hypothetical protein
MGKNRLNLKFFNVYAKINVDANKIIEKKNTSGIYGFLIKSSHCVLSNR